MGGDLPAIYEVAKNVWMKGKDVTLQEAAAVPYASIGMRVGDSEQGMLILASDSGSEQLWTSDAKIAISTRNGRIVRTAGFGRDLTSIHYQPQTVIAGSVITWQADLKDLGRFAVTGTCRDGAAKDEVITILGQSIATRRIQESCVTDTQQVHWSYTNIFWLDPETGFVWRSRQNTHPNLPPIEIEIFRPPG